MTSAQTQESLQGRISIQLWAVILLVNTYVVDDDKQRLEWDDEATWDD